MESERRAVIQARLRDLNEQLDTFETRRDNLIEERRDLQMMLRRMDDEAQGA